MPSTNRRSAIQAPEYLSGVWGNRVVSLIVVLLIGGCGLSPDLPLERPSPIPSPTRGPSAEPPTDAAASPIPTTFEATVPPPTPGPPTQPPPEVEGPVEVEPLAPGSELVLDVVSMADEERGWGVGGLAAEDNRVLRTADGGRTWAEVTPPLFFPEEEAGLEMQAFFLDASWAWAFRYEPPEFVGPGAQEPLIVWRTEDGGESWLQSEPRWAPFIAAASTDPYFSFPDGRHGWLLARAGGAGMHQYPVALLGSEDGGESWQVLAEPFGGQGLDSCHKSGMAFNGEGVGLLTVDSCPVLGAELRVTEDGGSVWQTIALPAPAQPPDLYEEGSCESHSPVVISSGEWGVGVTCRTFGAGEDPYHFLYLTADGGDSWQIRPTPTGELLYLGPEGIFALGREIHRSLDGARSWEQRKLVSWDGQFSFVSESVGWAVARSEDEIALVHTEDGAATWSIVEPVIGGDIGG